MTHTPANPSFGNSQPRAPRLRRAIKRMLAIALALAGIGLIFWLDNWLSSRADLPALDRDVSYGLVFLVGLFTGFHCVGMCGPLIVGYTAKDASAGIKSHRSIFYMVPAKLCPIRSLVVCSD